MAGKLPDLPGSTEEDFRRNEFHPFFKKTTRDIWQDAEINHTQMREVPKCEHYFEYSKEGIECKKCHFGLIGGIAIENGKIKGS